MSLRGERLGLKSAACYVAPSFVTVTLDPKRRDVRAEARHLHLAWQATERVVLPANHTVSIPILVSAATTIDMSRKCSQLSIHPCAAGDGAVTHERVQDERTVVVASGGDGGMITASMLA